MDLVTTTHNNKLIMERAARHGTREHKFVKRKRDYVYEKKLEQEARVIEAKRKEKLLRGNGKILAYYDPVGGRPSSYQAQFRQVADEAQCVNV